LVKKGGDYVNNTQTLRLKQSVNETQNYKPSLKLIVYKKGPHVRSFFINKQKLNGLSRYNTELKPIKLKNLSNPWDSLQLFNTASFYFYTLNLTNMRQPIYEQNKLKSQVQGLSLTDVIWKLICNALNCNQ
jgi:hypothetical protein